MSTDEREHTIAGNIAEHELCAPRNRRVSSFERNSRAIEYRASWTNDEYNNDDDDDAKCEKFKRIRMRKYIERRQRRKLNTFIDAITRSSYTRLQSADHYYPTWWLLNKKTKEEKNERASPGKSCVNSEHALSSRVRAGHTGRPKTYFLFQFSWYSARAVWRRLVRHFEKIKENTFRFRKEME